MPVTVAEKYNGRSGEFRSEGNRADVVYIAKDASSEGEAVGAVITAAPPTWDTDDGKTLYRGSASWEEIDSEQGYWEITVHYQPRERIQSEVNTTRISVDTSGGTQHITQSKQTVSKYPDPGAADMEQAIGVTQDSVEGVDITMPLFKFNVTKVYALEALPTLSTLYGLTGKVNDAAFSVTDTVTGLTISLLAGECLCTGVKVGEGRSDGAIELSVDFEASPNEDNLTVGSLTGIVKAGWDYMWVRYQGEGEGSGANKVLCQKPIAVYVERVYDEGGFSAFNFNA